MNTSNDVIRLIKNLREKKKMSVEELANRAGVAKSTLSRYENEHRSFPINDLGKYANALGTTIEYLLGLEKAKSYIPDIPLIGTICAGDGLLAEQNIEEYISYPFQSKRQPDYALRVKGDSMEGVGINDGDIVYMRDAQWAEHNGQIVAAIVNEGEDGMLKRMRWTEGSPVVRLVPGNDSYETLELLPNQIQVCGVYMGHFSPERG